MGFLFFPIKLAFDITILVGVIYFHILKTTFPGLFCVSNKLIFFSLLVQSKWISSKNLFFFLTRIISQAKNRTYSMFHTLLVRQRRKTFHIDPLSEIGRLDVGSIYASSNVGRTNLVALVIVRKNQSVSKKFS